MNVIINPASLQPTQVLQSAQAHAAERLAEAKARLQDELSAKAARDAKAAEAAQAAADAALEAERQLRGALVIQAHWRGFKVRLVGGWVGGWVGGHTGGGTR
jgi:hypothetical protein